FDRVHGCSAHDVVVDGEQKVGAAKIGFTPAGRGMDTRYAFGAQANVSDHQECRASVLSLPMILWFAVKPRAIRLRTWHEGKPPSSRRKLRQGRLFAFRHPATRQGVALYPFGISPLWPLTSLKPALRQRTLSRKLTRLL